jgi:hypothetical protein
MSSNFGNIQRDKKSLQFEMKQKIEREEWKEKSRLANDWQSFY